VHRLREKEDEVRERGAGGRERRERAAAARTWSRPVWLVALASLVGAVGEAPREHIHNMYDMMYMYQCVYGIKESPSSSVTSISCLLPRRHLPSHTLP
jgi:hypothetical protein